MDILEAYCLAKSYYKRRPSGGTWTRPSGWPDLDAVWQSHKDAGKGDAVYMTVDTTGAKEGTTVQSTLQIAATTESGGNWVVDWGHAENNKFVLDLSSEELAGGQQTVTIPTTINDCSIARVRPATKNDTLGLVYFWRKNGGDDALQYSLVYEMTGMMSSVTAKIEKNDYYNVILLLCTKNTQRYSVGAKLKGEVQLVSAWNSCYSLSSLDLSGWDVSNLTSLNLQYAWYNCYSLSSLDLSGWDTSSLTSLNLQDAWYSCSSLSSLDLSGWDTSNLTSLNLQSAWYNCYSLSSLDLSGWDVSSLTSLNLQYAWSSCSSLSSLDLSGWDVSSLTSLNLQYAWYCCYSLSSLDLSGWDLSNATEFNVNSNTFYGCYVLQVIKPPTVWGKASTQLSNSCITHDSIVAFIAALPTVTTKTTLTLYDTNKAKLTEDEIAVATEKGWTVA